MAMANQHTESVRFGLDGVINYSLENKVPYAIAGDNNGDYAPANLSQGWHTVRATPFAAPTKGSPISQPRGIRN